MPLRRGGIVAVAGALLASFAMFPLSADVYQAPRAALVLVAAALAMWNSPRPRRGRLGVLVGMLVAAAAVLFVVSALTNGLPSGVWGVHGRLQGLVTAASIALLGLTGYTAVGPHLERLAPLAMAPTLIVSGVVFVQAAQGIPGAGTMGNPVLAGGWLAVALAVCVAAFIRASGRVRWALLATMGAGTVAIGITGSRGAWIGLAVGVAAALLGSAERRSWRVIAPVIISTLVVGAVLAGPVVGWKLSVDNLTSGSAASRLRIWDDTSDLIAERPVLGVGPGRFLYEFPRHQSLEHAIIEGQDIRPDQAHSIPLHIAAESGIPASLLLVTAWGIVVFSVWRGARTGHPGSLVALAGIAAFGGQAVFGISTVEIDALAWLLGGAGLAGTDIAWRRDSEAVGSSIERTAGRRTISRAAAVVALVLAVATIYYVANDVRNARGDDAFASTDFDGAWLHYESAVAGNPLVDTYRLDLSDASSFLTVAGGEARLIETLTLVDEGLRLEPASYDLLLARARLLGYGGAPSSRVLESYASAIDAYPLGIAARLEAAILATESGDRELALQLARGVLEVAPEEPTALAIREAAE